MLQKETHPPMLGDGFHDRVCIPFLFFQGVDYCFERLRVVHCEVGKNFTVQFDTAFVDCSHELRIAHSVLTCTGVDTLNPQGTEVSFLLFTTYVSVSETFLDSVFRYGPDIFSAAEVTFGQLHELFSASSRSNVIYRSWHNFFRFLIVSASLFQKAYYSESG